MNRYLIIYQPTNGRGSKTFVLVAENIEEAKKIFYRNVKDAVIVLIWTDPYIPEGCEEK